VLIDKNSATNILPILGKKPHSGDIFVAKKQWHKTAA
jgi:hypothetical protein